MRCFYKHRMTEFNKDVNNRKIRMRGKIAEPATIKRVVVKRAELRLGVESFGDGDSLISPQQVRSQSDCYVRSRCAGLNVYRILFGRWQDHAYVSMCREIG